MARKARSRREDKIHFLEEAVFNNVSAKLEGPKKKTFSLHDIKTIKPLNEAQRQMFSAFINGDNVVASGSAGTGKSYVACFLALNEVLCSDTEQTNIKIIRSAVASRDIGHLPGSITEKLSVYEEPYRDIFSDLLKYKDAYDNLKDTKIVEFMSTSFVRGLTWDNAVVIIDEAQNMQLHEIHSIMTRIGKNSKVIVCGDVSQNDLAMKRNEVSGFAAALKIMEKMPEFDIVNFTENDIVRSKFVRSWIMAKQSM